MNGSGVSAGLPPGGDGHLPLRGRRGLDRRSLQRLGDDYGPLLDEHPPRSCATAVEAAGGREVDAAATSSSRSSPSPRTPPARRSPSSAPSRARVADEPVRVRIGLHTGDGDARGRRLRRPRGPPRRADLRTRATAARSCSRRRRRGPGRRRRARARRATELAGCREPERLYQLVGDGLPREFPPLRGARRRSSEARLTRRPRRRLGAAARGDRAPARGRGLRGRRRRPATPTSCCCKVGAAQARRRDRRHPHAADAHRRGPPRGAGDPRAAPGDGRARPLAVRRARRTRWSCSRRAPRASATCSKDRVADVGRVRRRRAARRRGRLGARPGGRLAARRPPPPATTRSTDLTPREREVLELMAEGRSNQAIAERLFVTPRAVEKHVTSIFAKLAPARRRRRTTAACSRCSLISPVQE